MQQRQGVTFAKLLTKNHKTEGQVHLFSCFLWALNLLIVN